MNRRHLLLLGLGIPPLLALRSAIATAANEDEFRAWLSAFRTEAAGRGFSARTLDEALNGLTPLPRVIELDRRQPEVTLTFDTYIARVINDARIDAGRQRLRENQELLSKVSGRYGVQPRFVVALWAIETDFGRVTGGFPVIQALATLAFEGRRAAFFREELYNALRIVEKSGIPAREMRGSWAGAMGQSQFMPSSYLSYAVDFDGDGKADIWNTRADVFASISNYLSRVGWRGDETWGREVRPTAPLDPALVDDRRLQNPPRTLAAWQALGVRRSDGGPLPSRDLSAWLVQPGGAESRSFLVYNNYKALLALESLIILRHGGRLSC